MTQLDFWGDNSDYEVRINNNNNENTYKYVQKAKKKTQHRRGRIKRLQCGNASLTVNQADNRLIVCI